LACGTWPGYPLTILLEREGTFTSVYEAISRKVEGIKICADRGSWKDIRFGFEYMKQMTNQRYPNLEIRQQGDTGPTILTLFYDAAWFAPLPSVWPTTPRRVVLALCHGHK
jgi:hypothetical protein